MSKKKQKSRKSNELSDKADDTIPEVRIESLQKQKAHVFKEQEPDRKMSKSKIEQTIRNIAFGNLKPQEAKQKEMQMKKYTTQIQKNKQANTRSCLPNKITADRPQLNSDMVYLKLYRQQGRGIGDPERSGNIVANLTYDYKESYKNPVFSRNAVQFKMSQQKITEEVVDLN